MCNLTFPCLHGLLQAQCIKWEYIQPPSALTSHTLRHNTRRCSNDFLVHFNHPNSWPNRSSNFRNILIILCNDGYAMLHRAGTRLTTLSQLKLTWDLNTHLYCLRLYVKRVKHGRPHDTCSHNNFTKPRTFRHTITCPFCASARHKHRSGIYIMPHLCHLRRPPRCA